MKDLPELQDQRLDEATVAALFDDLAALATIVEVRLKAGPRRAEAGAVTLAEARAAWEAGEVRGVQVRYTYAGDVWLDTLLRGPDGVRLVRMRA